MAIMRREFDLSEEDLGFLNSNGYVWETFIWKNQHWLVINDYPISNGYNVKRSNIALRLEGYPTTQIDMAYFYPQLSRKDGVAIKTVSNSNLDNKIYQQWSRHRTSNNPWVPGEDDISTHLLMFDYLLENELTR